MLLLCGVLNACGKLLERLGLPGLPESAKEAPAVVEQIETFDLLDKFGIDFAQGFYVGKPSPAITRRTVPIPIDAARRRRAGR